MAKIVHHVTGQKPYISMLKYDTFHLYTPPSDVAITCTHTHTHYNLLQA